MGARTFQKTISAEKGPDAAFSSLAGTDRRRNGNGSYTGTIGQKSGYKFRRRDPMPLAKAREFAWHDVEKTDKHESDAFVVPYYEPDFEEVEVEKKVRATSPDAAVMEALDRAGYSREDLDEINSDVQLQGKGYTAKFEKSTDTEKEITYEVKSDRVEHFRFPVSEEAAEEIPDALLDPYGEYTYVGPEGEYDSERKARSAITSHFAVLPSDDTEYEIVTVKKRVETTTFRATDTASEVSTWNVSIQAKIYDEPESPEAEGYIFYGWANE